MRPGEAKEVWAKEGAAEGPWAEGKGLGLQIGIGQGGAVSVFALGSRTARCTPVSKVRFVALSSPGCYGLRESPQDAGLL